MRIETADGATLDVGNDQCLLAIGMSGHLAWCPGSRLQAGDILVKDLGRAREALTRLPLVELNFPQFSSRSRVRPRFPLLLDKATARLAGLYTGNGYQSKAAMHLAVCGKDPDVVTWMTNQWRGWGVEPCFSGTENCVIVTAHSRDVIDFLVANDIHKQGPDPGAPSAHIPEGILRSPLQIQRGFLEGYFTTDGSASLTRTGAAAVSASTVSHRLALESHTLLRHHGLRASIRRHAPSALARHQLYDIIVADVHNVDLFARRIGFCCERKQGILEKARLPEEGYQTKGHVLPRPDLLDDLFRHARGLAQPIKVDIAVRRYQGFCNIEWAARLINIYPQLQESLLGKLLLIEGIDYDVVRSVTPLPEQDWASLTTATGEAVFANAFAVATNQAV